MEAAAIDLQGLRAFVAIAQQGSFHAAASTLHVSAPALTRRLQRIEEALGAALFERTTRQVTLTRLGEIFLPAAARVLDELEAGLRLVREFEAVRAGHIAVACLPTVTHHLLPRIIREFQARRPDIHLRVQQAGAASVVQEVRRGATEFGITFFGADDADLVFERLLTDPYCLVCPAGHPLTLQDTVCWGDLRPHRLITAGPNSGNMLVLDEALRGIDWRPETSFEINHLTTSLGLVEAGLGIAVVPRSALPSDPLSAVTTRPLINPVVTRTLGLIRRKAHKLTLSERDFLTTVRRIARHLDVVRG